jgi:hypothetical protein
MRRVLLSLLPLLASCGTLPPDPPAPADLAGPAASLDALPASDAIAAAAAAQDVPADLLAALAWVETGFATPRDDVGWLGFDEAQVAELEATLGVTEAALRERSMNLLAGAHRLAALRDAWAPDAGDVADEAWWPAVVAWSGSELHAAEVFAVLQGGAVAWTDEEGGELPRDTALDEPVVTIAPRAVDLREVALELPWSEGSEYAGALGSALVPAAPRAEAVSRIVLRATGDSFAAALSADAHYAVNRRDGAVVQLRREDEGAGDELQIALAAPDTAWPAWTAPLLEGAAHLAADLSARYGLLPGLDVDTSALGGSFPHAAFRATVACVAGGGVGCGGVVGVPAAPEPDDERDGADERDSGVPAVPYFYQYANSLSPGASCQNTSIAMLLKHFGWSGTPDGITARFGKDLAQSPAGLASVFNTLASEAGLSARLTARTNGTVEGLRALLDAGKPTIIHGYFTGYGHVLVALKYTGSGYVVNDPAGRWSQTFRGGYPYGWSAGVGRAITYGRAAFERAVATSNGSSPLPLWYHELTGVPETSWPDDIPEPPPLPEDPIGDDPTSGTDSPDPIGGASASTDGVRVELLEPRHGATVGDPLALLARRTGGAATQIVSGPWTLIPPTEASIVSGSVDLFTLGERVITARALSEYGTILAAHSARVTVQEVGPMQVWAQMLGGMDAEMTSFTSVPGVVYARYSVDGWPLRDVATGEERAWGTLMPLRYHFSTPGDHRLLRARGYAADGTLLAEGETWIDVTGDDPPDFPSQPEPGCAIVGEISCGQTVAGDTRWPSASDSLDAYTDTVGIWDAPELAWTFHGSGPVTVRFVDPHPSVLNLDIMILETTDGTCQGDQLMAIAWNWLDFEASSGKTYVFVVDGYDGAAGAFELQVDCG